MPNEQRGFFGVKTVVVSAVGGGNVMSDIANETIRYALSVVLENGNVRQLPRSYKDWSKAAQHGEKLVTAKRIKGFRIVVK